MNRRWNAGWIALALLTAAWICRLAWIAVPALDGAGRHAAEALYLAELDLGRHAALPGPAPTLEAIATEVHRRTTRLLIWIGLGLGMCVVAALSPGSRSVIAAASGLVYLLGWIRLDAYAHVGVLQGLEQKLRLVENDAGRLLQFAVIDAFLPLVVACAVATAVVAALRRAC